MKYVSVSVWLLSCLPAVRTTSRTELQVPDIRQADTVMQERARDVVAAIRLMKTANKKHYLLSYSSA